MIHHTENETTCQHGQAIATVICDSVNPNNSKRIITLELVYPRYIHSEFMTHRMFSRNASSSRATPINVMLNEVRNDCTFFDFVGENKRGMEAGDKLSRKKLAAFKQDWLNLAKYVADEVERMQLEYNIHKQTLNRALEPFSRIRTLVTATEWDNFFQLRMAADAQPEMRSLATAMYDAISSSEPDETWAHFPYITDEEKASDLKVCTLMQCSVARCARVCYGKSNGRKSSLMEDKELCYRLYKSGHMSPFEHIAFITDEPDEKYANYIGWRSWRNHIGH